VRQVSEGGREGRVGNMLGVVSSQAVTRRAGNLESMRIGSSWPMVGKHVTSVASDLRSYWLLRLEEA